MVAAGGLHRRHLRWLLLFVAVVIFTTTAYSCGPSEREHLYFSALKQSSVRSMAALLPTCCIHGFGVDCSVGGTGPRGVATVQWQPGRIDSHSHAGCATCADLEGSFGSLRNPRSYSRC